ncbi:MAG TPA: glycosyltransferase family 2 protein [bacterium]|nr:glycosyltransferase family 2 protein [bacterium]
MKLSVIIPNYNGKPYLGDCLDAATDSLGGAPFEWEIIVVDDASPDGSAEIATGFPGVKLIRQDMNVGFGATCNNGVNVARGDIVYLLNNDVIVEKDFWEHLLRHFDSAGVFAVTSLSRDENGHIVEARKLPGFVSGFLKPVVDVNPPLDSPSDTIYGSGGSTAFRRDAFLSLGGFDPLYHPFYWEDFDLGYRAWKRGMRVIFEPRSKVLHRSHGVIRSSNREEYIGRINRRNQLICNWKNLTDAKLRAAHFAMLAVKTTANVMTLRTYMLPVIKEVAAKKDGIRAAREKEASHIRISDEDVFRLFDSSGKTAKV